MKGFILKLNRAKNEDMIATVLMEKSIGTFYRFYGARHSILQLGHFVDFEIAGEGGRFMPHMRGLSHFGFDWLYERNRLMAWHDFIKLFEPHLRDAQELEPFYFELLLDAAKHWGRQNPKRVTIESHHALLQYEGRLHPIENCYICEHPIGDTVSLMPAYRPTHPECIAQPPLPRSELEKFFDTSKSTFLDDETVEYIYGVTMRGL